MKTTEQLYNFLNSYTLGVISTINVDGRPNSALIGFGQTKDLQLVFGTDNTSRKYNNLVTNQHIAFTIGGQSPETLQYEGVVRELDTSDLDLIKESLWVKNPFAQKRYENPNERYFIVAPTWLRYTDVRPQPWDITEMTF